MMGWLLLLLLQTAPARATGSEVGAASAELVGEAQDQADDTWPLFGDALPPDLRSARVEVSARRGMSLVVRFFPGTSAPKTTAIHFSFHLQQTKERSACGEYLVTFNVAGSKAGSVQVQKQAAGGRFKTVGVGSINVEKNQVQIAVPASALGSDLLQLKQWDVVVGVRLGDDAESRILDYLPDTSLPPASLSAELGRRTRR